MSMHGIALGRPSMRLQRRPVLFLDCKVGTLTLEQLFQAHEIDHCRLLKIIAPGAVCESLENSGESLRRPSLRRSGSGGLQPGEAGGG